MRRTHILTRYRESLAFAVCRERVSRSLVPAAGSDPKEKRCKGRAAAAFGTLQHVRRLKAWGAFEGWCRFAAPKRGEPQPAKVPDVAWHVAFGTLYPNGRYELIYLK